MKAFTERNPKVLGFVAIVVMACCIAAILFLNRSLFSSGYTIDARFANAAGIAKGTEVMVAGVNVGSVSSVQVDGNGVDASLSVNHSVQLPHDTTAAIEVETLLGVVDVTLTPVSGWDDPLKPGALITDTSVPTEFYQLQNTAHSLLSKTNAQALNNLVTSLANITKDKQTQVAQIIDGLGALDDDGRPAQRSGLPAHRLGQHPVVDPGQPGPAAAVGRQQPRHGLDRASPTTTRTCRTSSPTSTAMASQTNSLVGQDSPALNSLLSSLHADLSVVSQHQDDLAEGVSYLGSALKGFQSIAYSGSTPVSWGNIFLNPASLTNTFGVIGPCGTFDQILNQVLGPDPTPCDDQTGPLPGEGSDTTPGASSSSSSPQSSSSSPSAPSSPSSSSSSPTSSGGAASGSPNSDVGPNSGLGGAVPVGRAAAARGRMMGVLWNVVTSKVVRFALAGVVIVAGVLIGGGAHQGTGDLPAQRGLSERTGSLHRRRGRRPRRQGGHGHRGPERGQQGARHAWP